MALLTVTDPVVVVTGAGSGIGAATAILLARRGARVVLAGRREDALRTVAQECGRTSPALIIPTDVTDPADVAALGQAAAAHFGRIDAWVNNAGVTGYGRFAELPAEEFHRIVEVNLLGVANGMRTALLHLRRTGRGVIVNVASLLGEVPAPYQSAYTAAKYGVRGLSASVRQELRLAGERDIAVCTVLPASIDTPLFRHAANHTGRTPRPVPPVYPAQVAARTVVRALRHPRREVHAGGAAALTSRMARLAPALTERVVGRLAARGSLRHVPAPVGPGNLFAESDDDARIPGGHHGLARSAFRTSTAVGLAAGTAAVMMRRALTGRAGG